MSQLENRAKPLLIPLMLGTPSSFAPHRQSILATWIAKTAMTAEYRYPRAIAIPQEQRAVLMSKGEPPEGWYIQIADYHGQKWRNAAIFRQMISFKTSMDEIEEATMSSRKYVEITCFGLGCLFVQTISTPIKDLDVELEDEHANDFRQLWPPKNRILNWPPPSSLDDKKADNAASSLAKATGYPPPI
jgi:hypothetical protein